MIGIHSIVYNSNNNIINISNTIIIFYYIFLKNASF